MAISYVGGKGNGTAGQGGGSIAINSGLTGGSDSAAAAGDLVIVSVVVGSQARNPTLSVSTPSGYTALTQQNVTATTYDTSHRVSYKIMGSTPDTAVTIPVSGNNADGISYTIQVFRGVDSVTPMDTAAVYATGSGSTTNPDPAAITPVTAGAWIVVTGGGAAAAGAVHTAAYLTNFLTYNGPDTNDGSIGSGYYTGWTSGAYNPAQFGGGNANAANSWAATTLALRPAVSSYTITPTGSISFSGNNVEIKTKLFVPTGNITFTGTAPITFTAGGTSYTITPTGSVTFSGTAQFVEGKVVVPTGAIVFNGTSTIIPGRQINPTGSLDFSGASAFVYTKYYVPTGQIDFTGTAPIESNVGPAAPSTTRIPMTNVGF